MRVFDSIAKKVAIPAIVLFEIGWIIYTGGLGSYMHQLVRHNADSRISSSSSNANEVLTNPTLFPHYFTLVGGQFVALLFLFHAALPSSVASYIVGVLSSVLNVTFFVSVGYMVHYSAPMVRYLERLLRDADHSTGLESEVNVYLHALRSIIAGTILMITSWGLIQLLGFFYEAKSASQNQRSLWRVIRELAVNLPTSGSTSQLKTTPGELLRFCTIAFLILSAVGWCVCITGLYKLNDNTATIISYRYSFGTWATYFIPPFLYMAALLHAGFSGGASTMSGVFAAILNTLFVLNVGFTVVDITIVMYSQRRRSIFSFPTSDSQHNNSLILGGGVVCLFFWTIVYAAWHFYCCKGLTDHARGNDQPHHAQQNECGDTSFVPEQLPPYAKHLEAEMQPVN